nr:polyphosphate kinase [Pacificimonas pallii]
MVAVQSVYMRTDRRAVIVFEGHDAAGKGGTIRRLTMPLDPRFYQVWPIAAPDEEERQHHYLWRFWRRMPPHGVIGIFDRSWYGRVLVERVEGFAGAAEWQRAYEEINNFEALLTADNVRMVKLFMDVDEATQDARLKARLADPKKHWKLSAEDFRNRAKRPAYEAAIADMLAKTDTPRAPWVKVDGRDKKSARLAAIGAALSVLEKDVDLTPPPLNPKIAQLAAETF